MCLFASLSSWPVGRDRSGSHLQWPGKQTNHQVTFRSLTGVMIVAVTSTEVSGYHGKLTIKKEKLTFAALMLPAWTLCPDSLFMFWSAAEMRR